MFKTTITLKGESRQLHFSTWAVLQIHDLQVNDAEKLAYIIYFALIYGERMMDKHLEGKVPFTIWDIWDWIDESGGIQGEEFLRVQKVFEASMTSYVPKKSTATARKK